MYNSTECLNPRGSPPTEKCFDERDGESERSGWSGVRPARRRSPVHFAARTGTVKTEESKQG